MILTSRKPRASFSCQGAQGAVAADLTLWADHRCVGREGCYEAFDVVGVLQRKGHANPNRADSSWRTSPWCVMAQHCAEASRRPNRESSLSEPASARPAALPGHSRHADARANAQLVIHMLEMMVGRLGSQAHVHRDHGHEADGELALKRLLVA